jgi:transcriptional regulator with XRE-family HTH domain
MDYQSDSIAMKMKFFRKVRNMTQEELSKISGINYVLIRKYETGARYPKYDQLKIIAEALGVNVTEFLDFNIDTVGDFMSLFLRLEVYSNVKLTGKKDKNGKYKPASITLSFDDESINDALSEYLAFRDSINEGMPDMVLSDEEGQPLSTIEEQRASFLINDKKIKKPGK